MSQDKNIKSESESESIQQPGPSSKDDNIDSSSTVLLSRSPIFSNFDIPHSESEQFKNRINVGRKNTMALKQQEKKVDSLNMRKCHSESSMTSMGKGHSQAVLLHDEIKRHKHKFRSGTTLLSNDMNRSVHVHIAEEPTIIDSEKTSNNSAENEEEQDFNEQFKEEDYFVTKSKNRASVLDLVNALRQHKEESGQKRLSELLSTKYKEQGIQAVSSNDSFEIPLQLISLEEDRPRRVSKRKISNLFTPTLSVDDTPGSASLASKPSTIMQILSGIFRQNSANQSESSIYEQIAQRQREKLRLKYSNMFSTHLNTTTTSEEICPDLDLDEYEKNLSRSEIELVRIHTGYYYEKHKKSIKPKYTFGQKLIVFIMDYICCHCCCLKITTQINI